MKFQGVNESGGTCIIIWILDRGYHSRYGSYLLCEPSCSSEQTAQEWNKSLCPLSRIQITNLLYNKVFESLYDLFVTMLPIINKKKGTDSMRHIYKTCNVTNRHSIIYGYHTYIGNY